MTEHGKAKFEGATKVNKFFCVSTDVDQLSVRGSQPGSARRDEAERPGSGRPPSASRPGTGVSQADSDRSQADAPADGKNVLPRSNSNLHHGDSQGVAANSWAKKNYFGLCYLFSQQIWEI